MSALGPIADILRDVKSPVAAADKKARPVQMSPYKVRDATVEEQGELTQLCVRATMHSGYDQAFIDRVMPGLTVTVPLIAGVAFRWPNVRREESLAWRP
jgi:hypothetical protein